MKVKVRKLDQRAVIPSFATDGSAAFDLVSVNRDGAVFGTGLAFEVPTGHAMFVYSRSGMGFKENTRLANCVGVIDSDYRGEVKVKLARDDDRTIDARVGDKIAQAVIMKLPKIEFMEVDELTETDRGECGFGSTGK
jgi:dUTP pyrophosphatase